MKLAVDLGASKVDLALIDDQMVLQAKSRYFSRNFSCLADVVRQFLSDYPAKVNSLVAGVPGPVINGRSEITNLPWILVEQELSKSLAIPSVALINDIEAYGWGAINLSPDGYFLLNPGKATDGNRALIAPGTGLGQCIIHRVDSELKPSPSEGGHCDFAPSSKEDLPFVAWLYQRYPRISWERVVSGAFGFSNIYQYLKDQGAYPLDASLDQQLGGDNFGHAVWLAAQQNRPIARATMETFCRFLGAEAGNLALKACAVGGIYIGGGIAPQILSFIQDGAFFDAFCAKGRQKSLLEQIPIRIILEPNCSLLGAAYFAKRKFSK